MRALAWLVDLCSFGCLASSSSDATTRDPLAAIVCHRARPIRRACSKISMLLAHLGSVNGMLPSLPMQDIGPGRTASPHMAFCACRDLLECQTGSWTALFSVAVRSGAATQRAAICAARACRRRCYRMCQGQFCQCVTDSAALANFVGRLRNRQRSGFGYIGCDL